MIGQCLGKVLVVFLSRSAWLELMLRSSGPLVGAVSLVGIRAQLCCVCQQGQDLPSAARTLLPVVGGPLAPWMMTLRPSQCKHNVYPMQVRMLHM